MIKSDFELEEMASGFVKRDNTRAEELLGKVKLSLTNKQADGLIQVCRECYKEGARDMAKAYEENRKDFQNSVIKEVSKYAQDILNANSKELFRNRVITGISIALLLSVMVALALWR